MAMAHNLTCEFCSREISTSRDYQLVQGYERKRDGGGTNALRLRKTLGKWACKFCIDKEAVGISASQEGLFG